MPDHIGVYTQEETVAVDSESDVPPTSALEEKDNPAAEPENLQEYWRWVQWQLLRERAGHS